MEPGLTNLREHCKITHPQSRLHESGTPAEGDIVIIHDPTLNRGQWKLGKVVGSEDNFTPSAEIRLLRNGKSHVRTA